MLRGMSEITELLERFRRGPDLVAVAITGAAGVELDYVPAPGKWSIRQILCHLADSEIVAADRFRRVIAEENPTIMVFDQEAWAQNLDYSYRKISHALEMFRRMRGDNYNLLRQIPEAAFNRAGTHSKQGRVTLLDLLRSCTEHTERHTAQLEALRQAYRTSKRI